jgi:hypothetical protein
MYWPGLRENGRGFRAAEIDVLPLLELAWCSGLADVGLASEAVRCRWLRFGDASTRLDENAFRPGRAARRHGDVLFGVYLSLNSGQFRPSHPKKAAYTTLATRV